MQVMEQLAEKAAPPLTRRRFLKRLAMWTAAPAATGLYAGLIEPFWLDVKEVPIPIRNLPEAFEGYRIAHLTDLHTGDEVPISFLQRAMRLTRELNPDCVAVTGDLTTHNFEYLQTATDLLRSLELPTYVSFGNHDYHAASAFPGSIRAISEPLTAMLRSAGCSVLRNSSVPIERDGKRLWMVGLEDIYTDAFRPDIAFANRPAGEPAICLSHNPDSTEDLLPHQPDLILSGHTHGGQLRVPLVGAVMLPIFNRQRDQGRWMLPHGVLSISRGVGFLKQARFFCRPEILCYVLKRQA